MSRPLLVVGRFVGWFAVWLIKSILAGWPVCWLVGPFNVWMVSWDLFAV